MIAKDEAVVAMEEEKGRRLFQVVAGRPGIII